MITQFHDFNKIALGRCPADDQSGLFQLFPVGIVEFVAMAVALRNIVDSICLVRQGIFDQTAGIGAKSHGAPLVGGFIPPLYALGLVIEPLRHQIDNRIRCGGIDF